MPFEHALWRIDQGLSRLAPATLARELDLEGYIDDDVSILNERWLLIGRQIRTGQGGIIDLLAVDETGKLVLIELKKDLTPREVVAQCLDYASWVERNLRRICHGVPPRTEKENS
jgi:RecB family endonuclease NucS